MRWYPSNDRLFLLSVDVTLVIGKRKPFTKKILFLVKAFCSCAFIMLSYRQEFWPMSDTSWRALDHAQPISARHRFGLTSTTTITCLRVQRTVLPSRWWDCRWVFIDMSTTFHAPSLTIHPEGHRLAQTVSQIDLISHNFHVQDIQYPVESWALGQLLRARWKAETVGNKSEPSAAPTLVCAFSDMRSLCKQSSVRVRFSDKTRPANAWASTELLEMNVCVFEWSVCSRWYQTTRLEVRSWVKWVLSPLVLSLTLSFFFPLFFFYSCRRSVAYKLRAPATLSVPQGWDAKRETLSRRLLQEVSTCGLSG